MILFFESWKNIKENKKITPQDLATFSGYISLSLSKFYLLQCLSWYHYFILKDNAARLLIKNIANVLKINNQMP